jgi:hypothetical protein
MFAYVGHSLTKDEMKKLNNIISHATEVILQNYAFCVVEIQDGHSGRIIVKQIPYITYIKYFVLF